MSFPLLFCRRTGPVSPISPFVVFNVINVGADEASGELRQLFGIPSTAVVLF